MLVRKWIPRPTLVLLLTSVVVLLVYHHLFLHSFIIQSTVGKGDHYTVQYVVHKQEYPMRLVNVVNCQKIIEGESAEIQKATAFMSRMGKNFTEQRDFGYLTSHCDIFTTKRGYFDYPISQEEQEFPLAFSILLHENVQQMERLLRVIYRPHNYYCIHIDKSASEYTHTSVKHITSCFENVFIVSKTEDVIYAGVSRLKAEINCMRDLLSTSKNWKYLVNLPSTEFPLKTNRELVKIFKIYNGANDIEGISNPHRMLKYRYVRQHVEVQGGIKTTGKLNDPPPHNITISKGSAYGVFSWDFVNFALKDRRAIDLLTWMEGVKSPDEYFWATLNHDINLKAPGRYTGVPDKKPWLAAFAIWGGTGEKCSGKYIRGVCVYGIQDLNYLATKKELFANKIFWDYQPLVLDCLEEWLLNRTFNKPLAFDTYYYRQLPYILREK